MMAMNSDTGEGTSTCGWHCRGSKEMFVGDFEAAPSGWSEERVRRLFSGSWFLAYAVGAAVLVKQSSRGEL